MQTEISPGNDEIDDASPESAGSIQPQSVPHIIGTRRLRIPNRRGFGDDWINSSVSLTKSSQQQLTDIFT